MSDRIALAVFAVVAVLPALHPDVALYIDNAPHLAEVYALAAAWPDPVAWSDHQAGMAIGQLSAQAAWWPLAGLVRLGLPALPLYALAIVASNVVLALGVERLGARLLQGHRAGWIAGALAAACVFDLYGIAGAAGGMWPFRLACGLLAWGVGARWRSGLWIGAVCLLHTFAGVVVVLVTLVQAVRDRGRLVDLAVGLALCAGWWVPLLDPSLRSFGAPWQQGPADLALLLWVPFDVMSWRLGAGVELLGGPVALAWPLVVGPLAAWGLTTVLDDRRLGVELGLVLGLVLVGVLVLYPLTGFSYLGPNPWRHLLWWRIALVLSAASALSRLGRPARMGALGVVLVASVLAGFGLVPVDRQLRADLDATQALVAGPGRVFHQDTFFAPGLDLALTRGHAGALLGTQGASVVSSWYSVASIPTLPHTHSEGGYLFGRNDLDALGLKRRLKLYSVERAVTVTPQAAALFAELGATELGRNGPFVAWQLEAPPRLGAKGGGMQVDRVASDRLEATLPTAADILVRSAGHPWWEADVDGQPVSLETDPGTGLMVGSAPAGALTVTWTRRGLAWWLLAIPALGAALWRRRSRAEA